MLTAVDKVMEIWKRGDTEEPSRLDKGMEAQPGKKIAHSIEEILKRPSYVRREGGIPCNWSVISNNNHIHNQHPCAGMFLILTVKDNG